MSRHARRHRLGHDRPGIIAQAAEVLAALRDESRGLLDDPAARPFRDDLDLCGRRRGRARRGGAASLWTTVADVTVRAVPERARPVAGRRPYLLTVHGADRLGIVARLAGALADAGGNITDLTTRLAGELYVLIAEVDLPPAADVGALAARLAEAAAELGVDADAATGRERRAVTSRLRRSCRHGPGPAVVRAPRRRAVGARRAGSTRPTRTSSSSPPIWWPPCGSRRAASGWRRRRSGSAAQVFCRRRLRPPEGPDQARSVRAGQRRGRRGQPQEKGREGCMSVPDLTGDVKRPTRITVAGRLPGDGRAGA